MALKRWNGTAYEDVHPARYRATSGGPDVLPERAFVWDGTQFVEVWNRYGPLSPYSWSTATNQELPEAAWTTIATHTVSGEGTADLAATWRFASTGVFMAAHLRAIRIRHNGVQIGYRDHGGSIVMAQAWESSRTVPDVFLAEGDVLTFEGYADATNAALRTLTYSTFTVTPQ